MNVEDSPLLKRSRQSYSNDQGPLTSHLPSTFSFSRGFKSQTVVRKSPFSNSNYTSQKPVKANSFQHQPYPKLDVDPSLHAFAKSSTSESMNQLAAPAPFHDPSTLGQSRESSHVSAISQGQVRYVDLAACKVEGNGLSDFGDEIAEEQSGYAYGLSQPSQHPFKRESDGFSSLFHAELGLPINESGNIQDASGAPNNMLAYPCTTPSGDHKARANHSRGSSVVVSTGDRSTDDLPTLLIKSATDLRNTNLALEERTKALQRLQGKLDVVNAEKKGLLEQIALIKEKAKTGLETCTKKMNEMNNELCSVKSRSQEFFSFAQQATASMADIKEMKEEVKRYINLLVTSTENGIYAPTQGWRAVLGELQIDLSNKQQLIDMFRDRLEFAHGELAEAKNRIVELEAIERQHTNTLQVTSQRMQEAGSKVAELASSLGIQQQANTDILTKNVELETKCKSLLENNVELRDRLSQKEAELETFSYLKQKHEHLRESLADRDEQIRALHETKTRLARTEVLLQERETNIQSLGTSIEIKDKSIEELQKSVLLAETEATNQISLRNRLEKDLHASRSQFRTECELKAKVLSENDALRSRQETSVAEMYHVKKEMDEYKTKLSQIETRYEVLQERFEDQALMLRMEKKSHGDIQERLLAAEATYAETIDNLKRKSEAQSQDLTDKISKLESLLRERQAELTRKEQEYEKTLSDIEIRQSQRMREVEGNLTVKSEQARQVQKELDAARDEIETLRRNVQSLQAGHSSRQSELSEASRPSQMHVEEINKLKCEIDQLRKTNEAQERRASTIISRYEIGDLSVEEKMLIDAVHRASQLASEQQLVVKRNEIRQRDNTIKALEKRKSELESQLARVLNAQAGTKAKLTSAAGGRSLIDVDSCGTFQVPITAIGSKAILKAPDRDRPTTMLDVDSGLENPTSNLQADVSAHAAKNHQGTNVALSPPQALPFSELSELTTDVSGGIHPFEDDIASGEVTSPKRKRSKPTPVVEGPEEARPLRRTKTATRRKSRTADDVEEETAAKDNTHAPKVKARKRR